MIKDSKASFAEAEDVLDEICIADIGEEYRIFLKSDDGGNHIVVAFEEEVPDLATEKITRPFMGWRLIFLIVPKGYLQVFYPLNKKGD